MKKAHLNVTYKDGKVLDLEEPGRLRINELVEQVNAHSKVLALKDQVS